jgi:ribosome-associated protein
MLRITPDLSLDDKELSYDYIRSSGPGGQNVNKVSSAVQLRFDLGNSTSLPQEIKDRLKKLAGSRLSQSGDVVIEAKRYRTQEKNRLDAEQRLVDLVQKALVQPKKRRPTHPGPAAITRRIQSKKHHGEIKRLRRDPSGGSHEDI